MEKAVESYRKCLEKGMESYRKCIRYGESYGELQEVPGETYGELQKVSPLCRKLWSVIGNVCVLEKAMDSHRNCFRHEASYGELQQVCPF